MATEIGDCPDWYECRTKWQNLRVTFNTNLTKLHKIRSGQISVKSVRVYWRFFDEMQFVLKGSSQQSTLHCDEQNIVCKKSETPAPVLCDTVTTSSICDTDDTAPSICNTAAVSSICETAKISQRHKRSKRNAVGKPILVKRLSKSIAKQPIQLLSRPDEFSAFGEYVASELRCLSYANAQTLKRRMARLLLDFHEECGEY